MRCVVCDVETIIYKRDVLGSVRAEKEKNCLHSLPKTIPFLRLLAFTFCQLKMTESMRR